MVVKFCIFTLLSIHLSIMAKEKNFYTCSSCSYQTVKWLGCCPSCKQWETFEEHRPEQSAIKKYSSKSASVVQLNSVAISQNSRIISGIDEWDRVMGGGIMPGSLLVLTGDPGIGKSTLLLQLCNSIALTHKVFYFSTEESLEQVKMRAERLDCINNNLFFSDAAELGSIIECAREERPDLLILDSIQNCFIKGALTIPGSITQLREATFQLMRLAKEEKISVIITGHITKEGIIAGPKTLEHMVDAVFYLQGEDRWQTRILRAVKNRFGTINELGFFEMQSNGLQALHNINEHLLQEAVQAPGSVLISTIEGSRPLLLELQALTIESKLGIAQRVVSGIDHKQVVLIAAILEKYLQIKFSSHDIFFKVSGGIKIKGSSTDLGIACALLSSYFKQALPKNSIILGEISLTGMVKPINQLNALVKEAVKFGVQKLIIAEKQAVEESVNSIFRVGSVYELLKLFEL